ncbi:MAG: thiamine-phosphate kinase [Planctomycetes bacterium]|nr:thiamine-phosphate kinase [Planctomycetota bacterium]
MTEPRGEFAFIRWIRSQLASDDSRVSIGVGDDMAELRLPDGGRVLVGTDTILDGTHFDSRRDRLADVGWKALAENLSDVAAMAAVPVGAVGTLAVPRDFTAEQGRELFAGLKRCADEFQCSWVGGDITSWDQRLAITVTVLAHAERPVRRSGARVGQCVFVTGRLGGSLLGRHLTFRPRIAEARRLAETVRLGAMIDVSDGLSSDVGHICRESGVGVRIEAARVPVSDAAEQMAARDGRSPLDHALNDGEDFELLFTVDEADVAKVLDLDLGVEVTQVGRIVEIAQGSTIVDSQGRATELKPGGYEHWR